MSNVVALSVSGLPGGATASFSPPSVTGAGLATLTITTLASTPTNTYTLSVIGASAGLSHTNALDLVVTPPPHPVISSVSLNGTILAFTGTNGPAGGTFYVLSATNLVTPLSGWQAIATNAFASNGNFGVSIGLPPLLPGMFYLLKLR
jgi:hypothetical protein